MDRAGIGLQMDVMTLEELQESISIPGPFSRVLCMNGDTADYRLLPSRILDLLQATFPVLQATIHSRRTDGVDAVQVHSWEDYESVLRHSAWSPLVVVVESNGQWQIASDPDRSVLVLLKDAFEMFGQMAQNTGINLLKSVLGSWGVESMDADDSFKRRIINLFNGLQSPAECK